MSIGSVRDIKTIPEDENVIGKTIIANITTRETDSGVDRDYENDKHRRKEFHDGLLPANDG